MKEKLIKFCNYKHWKLNPVELYRSDSEKRREEYRKSRNGRDDFFWYIQTRELSQNTIDSFMNKTVEPIQVQPQTGYQPNRNKTDRPVEVKNEEEKPF